MARLIADQNDDGAVTPSDYFAFVANYTSGNIAADANQDGELTPADYAAWFGAYQLGDNGPIFETQPDGDSPWVTSIPSDFTGYATVYVDSVAGNDNQSGTEALPVRTLGRGLELANARASGSQPVALLLKAGGSYSGRMRDVAFIGSDDAGRPGYLGTYGGTSRATITATDSGFWRNTNSSGNKDDLRNSVIGNIEFLPVTNNSGKCIEWIKSDIDGVIIENCLFRNFKEAIVIEEPKDRGVPQGKPKNIALRRCIVKDNKVPGIRGRSGDNSSGLFAQNVNGLVFEQCVFDNNGDQSEFSHNVYLRGEILGFVATGCVFSRGGSHGLQARNGGIIRDNLFVNNPIGLVVAGSATTVERNVVVGLADIDDGTRRGWGIDWENSTGYTVIQDNIIGAPTSSGSDNRGIRFSGKDGPAIHGLIRRNWISGVEKPISTGAQNDEEHDIADIQITGNNINATGATTQNIVGTWPNAYIRNAAGTPNANNVTVTGNSSLSETVPAIDDVVADFFDLLASNPFTVTAQTRQTYDAYRAVVEGA